MKSFCSLFPALGERCSSPVAAHEFRRPAPADCSLRHRHGENSTHFVKKQKLLLFNSNVWDRETDLSEINKTCKPLRLDKLLELFRKPSRNKHFLPKCSFPALGKSILSDYPGWFIYLSRLLTWSLNSGTGIGVLPVVILFEEITDFLLCYFLWLLELTISKFSVHTSSLTVKS